MAQATRRNRLKKEKKSRFVTETELAKIIMDIACENIENIPQEDFSDEEYSSMKAFVRKHVRALKLEGILAGGKKPTRKEIEESEGFIRGIVHGAIWTLGQFMKLRANGHEEVY